MSNNEENYEKPKHFVFTRNGMFHRFFLLCIELCMVTVNDLDREIDNMIFFAKCLGSWQSCLLQKHILKPTELICRVTY